MSTNAGGSDGSGASMSPSRTVRVVSNREIARGVFLLRVPRPFSFLPGQVVAVTVSETVPARYYSIASGSRDGEIELLYDLVPNGVLTPLLARLAEGDRLLVSDPFGSFLDQGEESWWIATGTGIAPFVSMARSGMARGKTLLHGARTLDRFHFHTYLSRLPALNYVCCCSTEAERGIYPGRLTSWLRERTDLPRTCRYLLCGGSGMVVEVRDILIAKGVPFENIGAEIYF